MATAACSGLVNEEAIDIIHEVSHLGSRCVYRLVRSIAQVCVTTQRTLPEYSTVYAGGSVSA